jgi:hypothetical protein
MVSLTLPRLYFGLVFPCSVSGGSLLFGNDAFLEHGLESLQLQVSPSRLVMSIGLRAQVRAIII